jgi:hypothetical protein
VVRKFKIQYSNRAARSREKKSVKKEKALLGERRAFIGLL